MKRLLTVLCSSLFVLLLATSGFAQEKKAKAPKPERWEGMVTVMGKSSITVRMVGSREEKVINFDDSTKWVSQEHGSKKVNNIEMKDVKEGDRVICVGHMKDGNFVAATISKRLSGAITHQ